jgi:RND family efflux transporter MFP subunit
VLAAAGAQAASFECLIQPNQIVEMRSPVAGLISKVHVQRGDSVKTNQVLVELESSVETSALQMSKYRSEMSGRLTAAKERVDYATAKLSRATELNSKNFVSVQAREDAQAEMRVAQADFEDARENQQLARIDYQHSMDLLNLRTLRSPFDGTVIDRMLNPGELTQYGTETKPIMKLAQIDPLRVEVVLPVEYYGALSVGTAGQVTPEGLNGKFSATVKIIDHVFDAASGTFGARLELPNRQHTLPGGIRCKVDFPQLKQSDRRPPPK